MPEDAPTVTATGTRAESDPPVQAGSKRSRRQNIALIVQGQGLLLMAVVICVYFATSSPYFLTVSNALTIGSASAALGVMAIAQTFLIISGGMDVSVGSVVALTNVAMAVMVGASLSFWVAAPLAVLIGAGVGAVNGVLVVALGINPFISTLGTLSVFQGLAYAITGGQTRVANNSVLSYIAIHRPLGIPLPLLVMLVLFIIGIVVERATAWGKTIYAIGGNAEAARLAGLRVRSTQTALYVLSGASGGLAGVLTTAQLASGSPQVGSTYLLSVITAVILGGASLSGGRGSLVGTLVAVVILGMLTDGFSLLGWSSSAQQIALGVALVFAVLLDQTTRRLRGMGRR